MSKKRAHKLGAKLDRKEDEKKPKMKKRTLLVVAKGRAICGATVSRVLSGAEKKQPENMGDEIIPEYLHRDSAAADRALKHHMKAGNIVEAEREEPVEAEREEPVEDEDE